MHACMYACMYGDNDAGINVDSYDDIGCKPWQWEVLVVIVMIVLVLVVVIMFLLVPTLHGIMHNPRSVGTCTVQAIRACNPP